MEKKERLKKNKISQWVGSGEPICTRTYIEKEFF